jgi:hypothetical protein
MQELAFSGFILFVYTTLHRSTQLWALYYYLIFQHWKYYPQYSLGSDSFTFSRRSSMPLPLHHPLHGFGHLKFKYHMLL